MDKDEDTVNPDSDKHSAVDEPNEFNYELVHGFSNTSYENAMRECRDKVQKFISSVPESKRREAERAAIPPVTEFI